MGIREDVRAVKTRKIQEDKEYIPVLLTAMSVLAQEALIGLKRVDFRGNYWSRRRLVRHRIWGTGLTFRMRTYKRFLTWDINPPIFTIDDASQRFHWVLYEDGEVHYVSNALTEREVRVHSRFIVSPRIIEGVSYSVEEVAYSRLVVENAYRSLRHFALMNGTPLKEIHSIEASRLTAAQLEHLSPDIREPIRDVAPIHLYV